MVKNPDTGRRVSRTNAESEWQVTLVPHLAIVSADLFEAAKARKAQFAKVHPHRQRSAKRLLSGLLRCGCCGGGMSTKGKDHTGRVRLECSNQRENGTCPDPRTFYVDEVETTVLNGLRAELKNPHVFAEYVREYHAERLRLASKTERSAARLERRLGETKRETKRLIDHLAKGIGDPQVVGDHMKTIVAEGRAIEQQLADARAKPIAVALHPGVLKRYDEQLADLQEAVRKAMDAGDQKLALAIRDLVETVTVRPHPATRGRVQVEIVGRLNALLEEKAFPNLRVWSGGIVGSGGGI